MPQTPARPCRSPWRSRRATGRTSSSAASRRSPAAARFRPRSWSSTRATTRRRSASWPRPRHSRPLRPRPHGRARRGAEPCVRRGPRGGGGGARRRLCGRRRVDRGARRDRSRPRTAPAVVAGQVLPLGPRRPDLGGVVAHQPVRRDFHGKASPWHVGSGNNFALRGESVRTSRRLRRAPGARLARPGRPRHGPLLPPAPRRGARAGTSPASACTTSARAGASGWLRRVPYGYGMGACCVLWLRQRDAYGLRVLVAWMRLPLPAPRPRARPGPSGRRPRGAARPGGNPERARVRSPSRESRRRGGSLGPAT